MKKVIPIIDLFAGPGGLGEGFSSLLDKQGRSKFKIKLSIEKDENAHKTLRLRSFFRQFPIGGVPEIYYSYIRENNSKKKSTLLEQLQKEFPDEWAAAEEEAWNIELPYPAEYDENGEKTGGYTPDEMIERHQLIDERIKKALPQDQDFLLIGGPPCQAFSLVGRSRNQGISNDDHRVHLYKEYLRIIAKFHPAVFVMENVKGLLSAEVDGNKVFDLIKKDLKDPQNVFPEFESPKYKVFSFVKTPDDFKNDIPEYNNDRDFLIKSEAYGIPQKRHRVILLGVREDLEYDGKNILTPDDEVSLEKVIGNLPVLRSGIGREIIIEDGKSVYLKIDNTFSNWRDAVEESYKELRKEFPDTQLSIPDTFPITQGNNYYHCQLKERNNPLYEKWYKDKNLQGVLNHETRTHLKGDLCRYLFSSIHLKIKGDFPKLRDYPGWLLPRHKNAKGGKFADRFRTQRPDQPATTVTSHISKDGHYFIHYDPSQCRSLTVREAARIQTFPDNYYFCGTRTQQYHQVGNAVPPYLARQLAVIVKRIFRI